MATTFKKREVSIDRVVAVESATASVPIIGDVRMPTMELAPMGVPERLPLEITKLGSSQDRLAGSMHYAVGSVHDIPVELVKSNPLNPRAVYTSTAVDAMADSLKTTGQRISATAYADDQGGVTLIEGETRLRGTRTAGLPTLRIEIRPPPDQRP